MTEAFRFIEHLIEKAGPGWTMAILLLIVLYLVFTSFSKTQNMQIGTLDKISDNLQANTKATNLNNDVLVLLLEKIGCGGAAYSLLTRQHRGKGNGYGKTCNEIKEDIEKTG
jgi:spore maturation protein SpmB